MILEEVVVVVVVMLPLQPALLIMTMGITRAKDVTH